MKKELNKILMVIGFALIVLGVFIMSLDNLEMALAFLRIDVMLAPILAVTFIFAKNTVVKNVGYAVGALAGIMGIVFMNIKDEYVLVSIGMILMLVSAFLYFMVSVLQFFGFAKHGEPSSQAGDVSNILIRYREMQEENVLSKEEFEELKKRTLETTAEKDFSFDDLRKWKKLLDQKVISNEEFAAIKAKILR